ncbi:unnamed protein product, partial [Meganyctiphanes norvegica]
GKQPISEEHRLFQELFRHYNKHVRPALTHTEVTQVFFEISLFDILTLNTKDQQLITNTEMIMKWWDHYLSWDPADYNGTKYIRVPYTDIWYPDILLKNTADSDYQSAILNTNAIVASSGEVELLSHAIFTSVCNVNVEWFPFDDQTCRLDFASWTYPNDKIMMVQGPADLSEFHENPEFFLEDFWSILGEAHDPCCIEPFSTMTYFLQLQRRTQFSLFFFIMPGILINVCAVMVFSLPAESGEKVGLGINSMLAMMVFLMAMTENLPPTERLPLAGVYYGVCIIIVTVNIASSVAILNVNFAGTRGYEVPNYLKKAAWYLGKGILIKTPKVVLDSWQMDKPKVDPEDDETLVEPFGMDSTKDVQVFTVEPQNPVIEKLAEPILDYGKPDFTDPFQYRATHAVEEIVRRMKAQDDKDTLAAIKTGLVEEWKFVSRVFDRFLFIIFITFTVLLNANILTSSPFTEEFVYCPVEGGCEGLTLEDIVAITSAAAHNAHFADTGHGDDSGGGHGDGGHGGGHGDGGGGGHGDGGGGGHGGGGGGGHGDGGGHGGGGGHGAPSPPEEPAGHGGGHGGGH